MAAPSLEREIRRIRKKLRQIGSLESLERELNEEEQTKVSKKDYFRSELQNRLAAYQDLEGEELQVVEARRLAIGDNTQDQDTSNSSTTWTPEDSFEMKRARTDADGESEEPESKRAAKDSGSGEEEIDVVSWNLTTDEEAGDGDAANSVSDSDESSQNSRDIGSDPSSSPHCEKVQETATKSKSKKEATASRIIGLQKEWKQMRLFVQEFEGHNDVVTSVDTLGDIIVSASRDTTVRIWDAVKGKEVRSLGGHSATVTQVLLLGEEDSQALGLGGAVCVLSTSLDCSLKVWSTTSGALIKSLYTFSPILSMDYLKAQRLVAIGSDSGKLSLWSTESESNVDSAMASTEEITSIKAGDQKVYTGSGDGVVKVWEVREVLGVRGGVKLHLVWRSDEVGGLRHSVAVTRAIWSLTTAATNPHRLYLGDDGPNVKVLDWKEGVQHRLKNHLTEFGATNCICLSPDQHLLFTAAYDIDSGDGLVNVWLLPEEVYLGSVCRQGVGRLLSLASWRDSQRLRLVAGGLGSCIVVWQQLLPSDQRDGKEMVKVDYNWTYTLKPDISDAESDYSDSEDSQGQRSRKGSNVSARGGADHKQWCQVM